MKLCVQIIQVISLVNFSTSENIVVQRNMQKLLLQPELNPVHSRAIHLTKTHGLNESEPCAKFSKNELNTKV